MRTTVTFDSDNAAIIDKIRHDKGIGVSEAVNDLVRQASAAAMPRRPFKQQTAPLGALIDIRNTAEVLDFLEQNAAAIPFRQGGVKAVCSAKADQVAPT
ncbi:MAG: ribbon-helix-helix domain-containing protein [Acidimicrobiales bacterium]